MNLADLNLKNGHFVEIIGFSGPESTRERLHEMGFHVGARISFLGRAPFKGPVFLRFATSFLALRLEEAQCAMIRRLES